MDLVLVQAPGTQEEQIIPLAPGIYRVGSGSGSHIRLQSQKIREHHLNIECGQESLSITSASPEALFYFKNLFLSLLT